MSALAIRLLVMALASATLLYGAHAAWSRFTGHYIAIGVQQGVTKTTDELRPQITKLEGEVKERDDQLAADIEAFNKITATMTTFKRQTAQIQANVKAASEANTQALKTSEKRLAYIQSLIPKGSTQCEQTESVIQQLWR